MERFYGVLDSDTSREITRTGGVHIEARILIQGENDKVRYFVLAVSRNGEYSLDIEDDTQNTLEEVTGNAFTRKMELS